jgi:putative toxin-antitoxin system antitoxin component (TIGR02293 family)
MSGVAEQAERQDRVASLLGLSRQVRRAMRTPLAVHEALVRGLPVAALDHAVARVAVLRDAGALESAIGVSLRSLQRYRQHPARPLGQEQSGRLWKLGEIITKAEDLFGGLDEAERWLASPAMGLEGWRPIDLLATPKGTELVDAFLDRLEAGVYT